MAILTRDADENEEVIKIDDVFDTFEEKANKKGTITNTNDTDYPTSKAVKTELDKKEDKANKKTTLTNSTTDYPTTSLLTTEINKIYTKSEVDAMIGTLPLFDPKPLTNRTLMTWESDNTYQFDDDKRAWYEVIVKGGGGGGGSSGINFGISAGGAGGGASYFSIPELGIQLIASAGGGGGGAGEDSRGVGGNGGGYHGVNGGAGGAQNGGPAGEGRPGRNNINETTGGGGDRGRGGQGDGNNAGASGGYGGKATIKFCAMSKATAFRKIGAGGPGGSISLSGLGTAVPGANGGAGSVELYKLTLPD
jgi:hypothetical protein